MDLVDLIFVWVCGLIVLLFGFIRFIVRLICFDCLDWVLLTLVMFGGCYCLIVICLVMFGWLFLVCCLFVFMFGSAGFGCVCELLITFLLVACLLFVCSFVIVD